MPLATGRLRSRVEIMREISQSDGYGGRSTEWESQGTLWCEAISQNGREAIIAGTLTGVSSWRITMRYGELSSSITPADQLRLNGKDLNIRSAEDPDDRREQIVVFADSASTEAGTSV